MKMTEKQYKQLLKKLLNDAFVPISYFNIDYLYENRLPPFMMSRKMIRLYYKKVEEQYEDSISLTII